LKPNFPQARINLANALAQNGKLEDAEAQAREAVRIAPNDSEAHRTLGRILSLHASLHADRNAAITELERAAELEPSRADLQDEAAAQFSDALHLQPDYPAAKLHLGVIRWQQKSLDDALGLLQSAVQLDANNPQSHYYLARVLEETNQRDQAITQLQATVKLQPDFADAQNQLGLLLQRAGDADGAVAAFRQVLRLQPDSADAHNNLGLALIQTGDATGS